MTSIVIIGAGECGGRTALQLRERGFDGAITLVGAETLAPYERPPLSKDGLLSDNKPRFIAGADDYAGLGIDLRIGATARRIDRTRKTVLLDDGNEVAYDRLLLATGARARTLPGLPATAAGIHTLRSHADAVRLRPCLKEQTSIAIVGGGFIGLELAAAARTCGMTVTLIEGLPRILSRGVPAEIAMTVADRHRAAGVDLRCNAGIASIETSDHAVTIAMKDGSTVVADIAVIGIGSVPNTEIAAEAGLAVDNGITVDRHLRTSDPDILAAGDCCSFPLALHGGRHVRLESWRSAQEHAVLAAANLTGAQETLNTIPWFWSDQYELTLQVAGLPSGTGRSIRRDLGAGAFIIFELDDNGRLLAASGIGTGNAVARDIRLAEMLIAAGRTVDPEALAAPDTKLKSLLAA